MRPQVNNRGTNWTQCVRRSYGNWLLLAMLIIALPILEVQKPRRMYITRSLLDTIKFPFHPSTVPAWSVPVYSVLAPSAVIAMHGRWEGLPATTTHASILGALISLAVNADVTNFFKLQVGRPRPNFFYRCFPDGNEVWKEIGDAGLREPECHPKHERDVVDGYKSFPSGHTSWSFSSLFFLSLYLYRFLCTPARSNNGWALMATFLPTTFAAWVGATRVTDYYHNASDVVAGALLGSAIAALVFNAYVVCEPPARLPAAVASEVALLPRHLQDIDAAPWARNRSAPAITSYGAASV